MRSPSSSSGLDAWANAWTTAEASGPYLNLTQTEVVVNPADLGLAVLGGPQAAAYLSAGLGPGYVNPPTYSSAGAIDTDDRPFADPMTRSRRVAAPTPVLAEPAQTRGDLPDRHRGERLGTVLARRLHAAALARPRGTGDPIMRSRHHHPGSAGTVVKVVVFAVAVRPPHLHRHLDAARRRTRRPATGYVAEFTNASGLQAGDTVRIAGVEVGKVSAVTLQQNHADVSFSVDTSQHLTTTTLAAIHFENLLGQRFLAILPGHPGGKPLPPGGVIPLSRTTPAINLTAVFDGFQPLFSALSPDQVNQLAGSIIDVFQGESGTVSNIVAETAALTNNLADRQQVIDTLLTSLSSLLNTVGVHDTQLGSADRELRHLDDRAGRVTGAARFGHRQPGHGREHDEQSAQRGPAHPQPGHPDAGRRPSSPCRPTSRGWTASSRDSPVCSARSPRSRARATGSTSTSATSPSTSRGQLDVSLVPGVSPTNQYPNPVTLPSGPIGDQAEHTASCS